MRGTASMHVFRNRTEKARQHLTPTASVQTDLGRQLRVRTYLGRGEGRWADFAFITRELDLDAAARAVRARVAVLHRELHAVRDRIPLRRGSDGLPVCHNSASKAAGLNSKCCEAHRGAVNASRLRAHVERHDVLLIIEARERPRVADLRLR